MVTVAKYAVLLYDCVSPKEERGHKARQTRRGGYAAHPASWIGTTEHGKGTKELGDLREQR
eukprot:12898481-Prorocentrum_lima.AAC.1